MNKIKLFFKSIPIFIKKHEKIIVALLAMLFIFVYGVSLGVVLCCCNNHNEENFETVSLTSATTENTSYYLADGDFAFDLGTIQQVLLQTKYQSDYGITTRMITTAMPLTFKVEDNQDSFGDTGSHYKISLNVGTRKHLIPNDNKYYKSISNSFYTNITDYQDYIYKGYSEITHDSSTVEMTQSYYFRYNGTDYNNNGKKFGFHLANQIATFTDNDSVSTFLTNGQFNTWFYFAFSDTQSDLLSTATRLVSYTISYEDFSLWTDGEFNLYLPYMRVYSFKFDNGLYIAVGMPYLVKYSPDTTEIGFENQTFYFDNIEITDNYQLGYDYGYSDGKVQGFKEGKIEGEEIGFNKGLETTLNDVSPFNALLSFVDNFLSVDILGDISIGNIISIGLGVLLLGLFIKTFLGG